MERSSDIFYEGLKPPVSSALRAGASGPSRMRSSLARSSQADPLYEEPSPSVNMASGVDGPSRTRSSLETPFSPGLLPSSTSISLDQSSQMDTLYE